MNNVATNDGRGIYKGLSVCKESSADNSTEMTNETDDFLVLNYYLEKEFYPDLEWDSFKNYWADEFKYLEESGVHGQLQLNFPEIPLIDLMEKYRKMTQRLKGGGERAEEIRNYYPGYFTEEILSDYDSEKRDSVTVMVENSSADQKNDPTIFGMGMPYGDMETVDTMAFEKERIITELSHLSVQLEFYSGDARTRVIQSLLFMKSRLLKKERKFYTDKYRIKFWAIQLMLSAKIPDGPIPYIFMDGGGGVCLGRDGGSGNSVYGFCIQAVKK